MKKIILLSGIICLSGILNAQKMKNAEVPAGIKDTFGKMYPNVKDSKWKKTGNNYEASFMISMPTENNGKKSEIEKTVILDDKANFIGEKEGMSASDLPGKIKDYMNSNYGGKKITEVSKVILPTGDLQYDVEISGSVLLFDADGNFLKNEKYSGKGDTDTNKN